MQAFERLTCLNASDLDNYAASLGAMEYALEDNNITTATQKFLLAQRLRRMEEAKTHDGAQTPLLDELLTRTDLPDCEDGEMRAYYAFRSEIERMAALSR